MRVALASLDQVWQDKAANLARCERLAGEARAMGSALLVFPEMTLTGYTLDASLAEPAEDAPSLRRLGELARRYELDVVFGAALRGEGDARPRNTLCAAHRDGRVDAVYTKLHPFTFAGEEQSFQAGQELAVFHAGGLRLGCGICYDLRFPEPFSAMAPDCDACVVIANWPARRVEHWRVLLRARAIENQCFVLGVNRIGQDGNGLHYEHSSLLVAPDGELVQPIAGQGELEVFEIDPAETARYRAAFPTVRDKRFVLYRRFLEARQ